MSLADDLCRLNEQSRARRAAAEALREQYQFIARQSRRRLDESRLLLQRRAPTDQV